MTKQLKRIQTSNWINIVWDIETNGFLPDVSELWCLSIEDLDSGESLLFSDHDPSLPSISVALPVLESADVWAGQNLIGYDILVMEYLGYTLQRPKTIIDTFLVSQVVYPNIIDTKFPHRCPKNIKWSHSLKAWGHRLGEKKIDFDDFSQYSTAMGKYCQQDTHTNAKLFWYLKERAEYIGVPWEFEELPSPLAIEHKFKYWISKQERTGFPFDKVAAEKLVVPLLREQEEINAELQEVFPPITETIHYVTKVRKEKKTKTKTTVFNPGSRQQVAKRLIDAGWEPSDFTDTGLPKVNETTMALASEVVPQAKLIDKYFTLNKRLGMLANGKQAWLKQVIDGRIHGSVKTNGAVTTRVTHVNPNLSQVPAVDSYLGKECRSLFHAREGWSLVGADLAGIELRCLAHYLARYDGGEYADHVLNGDVHTVHQRAFGIPDKMPGGKKGRSVGKTVTYGWLYGAGDWKLGISGLTRGTKDAIVRAGKGFRDGIETSIPALGKVAAKVKAKSKSKTADVAGPNVIRSIAGYPLYCRSPHSSLNTLLQSAGAQGAKVWTIVFHETMADLGYLYGEHYEQYCFAHDELQCGCPPELADVMGEVLCQSAIKAGEILKFRVPVEAEYKTGYTWSDTH